MTKREEIAAAIDRADRHSLGFLDRATDAVLDAMRDVPNNVLAAGYEAMFTDKWDGTQAPMMGAGWDAMIDSAKAGA